MGASQVCAMPSKCLWCGRVFDLSYDLDDESNIIDVLREKGARVFLCWNCRDNCK